MYSCYARTTCSKVLYIVGFWAPHEFVATNCNFDGVHFHFTNFVAQFWGGEGTAMARKLYRLICCYLVIAKKARIA
jgi:hypothetical protein